MKRKSVTVLLLSFILLAPIFAHDLFLRLDDYFVKPGEKISIKILNGSFQESECAVSQFVMTGYETAGGKMVKGKKCPHRYKVVAEHNGIFRGRNKNDKTVFSIQLPSAALAESIKPIVDRRTVAGLSLLANYFDRASGAGGDCG